MFLSVCKLLCMLGWGGRFCNGVIIVVFVCVLVNLIFLILVIISKEVMLIFLKVWKWLVVELISEWCSIVENYSGNKLFWLFKVLFIELCMVVRLSKVLLILKKIIFGVCNFCVDIVVFLLGCVVFLVFVWVKIGDDNRLMFIVVV